MNRMRIIKSVLLAFAVIAMTGCTKKATADAGLRKAARGEQVADREAAEVLAIFTQKGIYLSETEVKEYLSLTAELAQLKKKASLSAEEKEAKKSRSARLRELYNSIGASTNS